MADKNEDKSPRGSGIQSDNVEQKPVGAAVVVAGAAVVVVVVTGSAAGGSTGGKGRPWNNSQTLAKDQL
jgi:hypothetical protein